MNMLTRVAIRAGRALRTARPGPRVAHALLIGPECAALLVMIALIWFGIWNTLADQYRNAASAAARDTGNLARAFEENTERIFAGADRTLLSLRTAYERDKAGFDLATWSRTQNPADRLTAQLAVIDRDGMALASTASVQRVSIADRPHFLAQRGATGDTLLISRPVLGRSSNRWSIQVTRRLVDAAGAFDGIVVLSVDCYDLSAFYQTLDVQQGFISLVGTDGIVRARAPMTTGDIGADRSDYPAAAAARQSREGTLWGGQVPGTGVSTVSFRRLETYPLVVVIGFADAQVFARYHAMRVRLLAGGAGGTVAIVALGVMWIGQRARAAASRRALTLTLESMSQGIVMIDAKRRIAVVNRRAIELLRLPAGLLGTSSGVHSHDASCEAMVARALADFVPIQGGLLQSVIHPDGTVLDSHRETLPDGGVLQTITDVTARRSAEERISQLAHYDHLTGLGNRVLLAEQISLGLGRWEADGTPFAVLCIDLDGFKTINDTLGHDVGDEVLVAVGRRLCLTVGSEGFVARSGGDEFIVLSQGQCQPGSAQRLGRMIVEAFSQPFQAGGHQLCIGTGIGIASCPENGTGRADLMKHADMALYCAKADKRDPVQVFNPAMAVQMEDRAALEHDLRAAVEADALHVAFQPQFKTAGLGVVGFEALVRWTHPVRGALRPDAFISVAEETGLIIRLGQQVLERACKAAMSWPESIRVAVNISPVQFRDAGLTSLVAEVLARTGLAPTRLELEVTEGVLIADERQALQTLSALQALGIRVALDDFGTGYASLSTLRRFPFDCIKLDRSFVQAQVDEPKARAILDSILMLSRRLHLGVVAEGVETDEQLALLRDQRCPDVQGFLTGRPMPEAKVAEFLANYVGAPPMSARDSLFAVPIPHALAGPHRQAAGNTLLAEDHAYT